MRRKARGWTSPFLMIMIMMVTTMTMMVMTMMSTQWCWLRKRPWDVADFSPGQILPHLSSSASQILGRNIVIFISWINASHSSSLERTKTGQLPPSWLWVSWRKKTETTNSGQSHCFSCYMISLHLNIIIGRSYQMGIFQSAVDKFIATHPQEKEFCTFLPK